MVKFTATLDDGKTVVGLGLSQGNWEKLRDKKPISVSLRELNLPHDIEILILGGEDEQEIANDLRDFIGPKTLIHSEDDVGGSTQ